MKTVRDLMGKVFGRLKVVAPLGIIRTKGRTRGLWWCICTCGEGKAVNNCSLVAGNVRSCGCLRKNSIKGVEAAISKVIWNYKRHAKERKLKFLLSRKVIFSIITKNCHYCDAPPANMMKSFAGYSITYSGIDRLDSALGYTNKNCVPCCAMCNRMKRRWSEREFIEKVRAIAKFTEGIVWKK